MVCCSTKVLLALLDKGSDTGQSGSAELPPLACLSIFLPLTPQWVTVLQQCWVLEAAPDTDCHCKLLLEQESLQQPYKNSMKTMTLSSQADL